MRIKHLQGNTYLFNNPQAVWEFIIENEIDIACLQEITADEVEKNYLAIKSKENGFHFRFAPHWFNLEQQIHEGVAIISRFPIIDSVVLFHNGHNGSPKSIGKQEVFGKQLIGYDPANFHPASRAVTYQALSTAIQTATIEIDTKKFVKVINTHFPVSDFCTELSSMYEIAQKIVSLIKYGEDLPIIMSGDLNVRAKSYSVELLETLMTCHTKELDDTLSSEHSAKKRGSVDKLAIDHVFSKGLKLKEIETKQVDFSDHKMLIIEFDIE